MVQQLRHEACSGSIEDLAHVVSEDCLADPLTKSSAKPEALLKAVDTGVLPNVDKHIPFRQMMADRHKAYLVQWILHYIPHAENVIAFFGMPVRRELEHALVAAE